MGMMTLSSDQVPGIRQARRTADGVPVFAYRRMPGLPPVTVTRWDGATGHARLPDLYPGMHAHEFLVLVYVEDGSGAMRVDGHDWSLGPGDAVVIAPGATVAAGADGVLHRGVVWVVFFPSDAVDPAGFGQLVSWRPHPLLFPFARGTATGSQRMRVPPADRDAWIGLLDGMVTELRARRDSYAEAVRAQLTLLLVRLARLDTDVAGDLRVRDEPLLAAVFDVIESRFGEPISLRDVADAVGLSPGHLTTVVGDRTGRTVQQWITERRMREARRLLADTDTTMAALAARVGYRDAGYFIRRFRGSHGVTPAQWRRAGQRVSASGSRS